MTTYATQQPVFFREYAQADISQEPFNYRTLTISFTYVPGIFGDQQIQINSTIPNTYFSMHAHPDLCKWNEGGFWVWDMELVDSYLFTWVLANKDKLDYDISEIVRLWTGKDK